MFVSHHTLKWTRTCRSHGRHPHAHTAHFLLNRHTRVRMGMLHEDRAPTTGVIHPRRPAEGRKGNDARTGRQRRARIRDRHRLERIPHHHAIPQHHRLTTKTSLKHHKSSYRPEFLYLGGYSAFLRPRRFMVPAVAFATSKITVLLSG